MDTKTNTKKDAAASKDKPTAKATTAAQGSKGAKTDTPPAGENISQGESNATVQPNAKVDKKDTGKKIADKRAAVIERYRKFGAADTLYMTSDDLGFIRRSDAAAHAVTLADKSVEKITIKH